MGAYSACKALVIGVGRYADPQYDLSYARSDAEAMAELLGNEFGFDQVWTLYDNEATRQNLIRFFEQDLQRTEEDDGLLIFFAGHGREMGGKCYLVPGDATLQTIHVTGIPVPYIQELLNRCKARQKVLILDACHSGAGRDVSTMAAPMMETLSAGKGIYTLTSCDVDELSHEWDEKKQGVFSYYLAEALSGSCPPDGRGQLTVDGIYDWVYDQVTKWATTSRCQQSPRRICQLAGTISLGSRRTRQERRDTKPTQQKRAGHDHLAIDAVAIPARLSKPATLPEWAPYLLSALAKAWNFAFLFCLGLSIFPAALMLITMDGQPNSTGAPVNSAPLGYSILLLGLCASVVWFGVQAARIRNRYHLLCAQKSLSQGDWVGGSDHGLAIKRFGVDPSAVGTTLLGIAALSAKCGDDATATAVCEKAARSWKSPHAKRALANRQRRS